jgi:hypothetical protein
MKEVRGPGTAVNVGAMCLRQRDGRPFVPRPTLEIAGWVGSVPQ